MNKRQRRIATMGRAALDWCMDNPWEAAEYQKTVTQLQEYLSRIMALGTQRKVGVANSTAGTVSKAELGFVIRREYLVPISRIARAASADRPELLARFQLARDGVDRHGFIANARAILQEARHEQALFQAYGVSGTFLADLEAAILAYDAVEEERNASRAQRVGATADIAGLCGEVLKAVRRLDAMNRNRFQHDRERLAAWTSARNVAWPRPTPPALAAEVAKVLPAGKAAPSVPAGKEARETAA